MAAQTNELDDLRCVFRSFGDHLSGALAQASTAQRLNLSFNIESSPRIDMRNHEHVPYILAEVFGDIKRSNPNFYERIKNALGKNIGTLDNDLIITLVDIGLIQKLPHQVQKKLESRYRFSRGLEAFLDGLTLGPLFRPSSYYDSKIDSQNLLDRIAKERKLASYRWVDANLKAAQDVLPTI